MVNSAKSRRHLECRSFKLERRTITPGSIVPRLRPSFQRWLLTLFLSLTLQTARRPIRPLDCSALVADGSARKSASPYFYFKQRRSMLGLCKMKSTFAGGEDMGYFDC